MLEVERVGLASYPWFKCLDTFKKWGIKMCLTYFFTMTFILFQLAYFITHSLHQNAS
jgi:hypothetical protein